MKLAMFLAMLMVSASAVAADEPVCGHSVDRNPDNVGYSVSARQAAEIEQPVEQFVSASRVTLCGPSSVGYSVTARRAANERENPSLPAGAYVNSSKSNGNHPGYVVYGSGDTGSGFSSGSSSTGKRHRVGGESSSGKGGHYVRY